MSCLINVQIAFNKAQNVFNIYLSHILNVQKMNYYQMYIMYCSKPVVYKRHRVGVEDWSECDGLRLLCCARLSLYTHCV